MMIKKLERMLVPITGYKKYSTEKNAYGTVFPKEAFQQPDVTGMSIKVGALKRLEGDVNGLQFSNLKNSVVDFGDTPVYLDYAIDTQFQYDHNKLNLLSASNWHFHFFVIDIDATGRYKDLLYNQISGLLNLTDKHYIENTPSGGIHIPVIAMVPNNEVRNKAYQVKLLDGANGQVKVGVDILATKKMVVVAPSCAVNKQGTRNNYIRVQGHHILDDAVQASYDQVQRVIKWLDNIFDAWTSKYSDLNGNKHAARKSLRDEREEMRTLGNYGLRSGSEIDRLDYRFDHFLHKNYELEEVLERAGIEIPTNGKHSESYVAVRSIYTDDGQNPDMYIYRNREGVEYIAYEAHGAVSIQNIAMSRLIFDNYRLVNNKLDMSPDDKEYVNWIHKTFGYSLYNPEKNNIAPDLFIRKFENIRKEVIEQYVNDNLVYTYLTKSCDVNIIAPTGSGKTSSIVRAALNHGLRIILLQPYAQQVTQTAHEYNIPYANQDISARDFEYEVREAFNRKVHIIASTYDSLYKIIKLFKEIGSEYDENLADYTLVIDEYHNLTIQQFRGGAIKGILKNAKKFKKVVALTGTPEGVLYHRINLPTLYFEPKENITNKAPYIILKKNRSIKDIDVVADLIKKFHKPGTIDFVLKNQKSQLISLKKALEKKGFKCALVTADHKNEPVFKEIVEYQEITSDVDVVLSTIVINDGINILNRNIGHIYLGSIYNPLTIKQYIGRFRNGATEIYDIVNHNKNAHHVDPDGFLDMISAELLEKRTSDINLNKAYKNQIINWLNNTTFDLEDIINKQDVIEYIKNNSDDILFFSERAVNTHDLDRVEYWYYDAAEKKVKSNPYAVQHDVIEHITSAMKNAETKAAWLRAIYGFDVKVSTVQELTFERIDTAEANEEKAKAEEKMLDRIYEDPRFWTAAYASSVGPILDKMLKSAGIEMSEITPEVRSAGRDIFGNSVNRSVMYTYIQLYNILGEQPSKELVASITKSAITRWYKLIALKQNYAIREVIGEQVYSSLGISGVDIMLFKFFEDAVEAARSEFKTGAYFDTLLEYITDKAIKSWNEYQISKFGEIIAVNTHYAARVMKYWLSTYVKKHVVGRKQINKGSRKNRRRREYMIDGMYTPEEWLLDHYKEITKEQLANALSRGTTVAAARAVSYVGYGAANYIYGLSDTLWVSTQNAIRKAGKYMAAPNELRNNIHKEAFKEIYPLMIVAYYAQDRNRAAAGNGTLYPMMNDYVVPALNIIEKQAGKQGSAAKSAFKYIGELAWSVSQVMGFVPRKQKKWLLELSKHLEAVELNEAAKLFKWAHEQLINRPQEQQDELLQILKQSRYPEWPKTEEEFLEISELEDDPEDVPK